MWLRPSIRAAIGAAIVIIAMQGTVLRSQQTMDALNLDRSRGILRDAYENVKKHYYDPKYHGLDIDARYHEFDAKIQKASSLSQAFGLVAGFLDGLNDSHTFFEPPSRPYRIDYGYRIQIFGEDCFITRVRPGTDAESKVHPGDQVLGYNNFAVNRGDLWKMSYYFNSLSPQKASILALRGSSRRGTQDHRGRKISRTKKSFGLYGRRRSLGYLAVYSGRAKPGPFSPRAICRNGRRDYLEDARV